MASTIKRLVEAKYAENAQTSQYTATTTTTIDTCTVTNVSANNVSLSANIVPPAGSAGASNLIIKTRVIVPNQTYHCPELVGKVLSTGTSLSTLASAASALVIDVTGREFT